ncbi:hypothetical protein D9615_006232 [Tricholomella constricta]|uniref:Uncharacterized protein n=1 Tax=Tricholomella constricta TaxID=117010 RepID=A0A8H5HAU5_9AGAR|nr:hypothetical protein D9615_006232 [Tricholomella constricta]
MSEATLAPVTGPHLIRITDSGKIKGWVTFALSFLEANENRPVVFHTLPFSSKTPPTAPVGGSTAPAPESKTTTSKIKSTTLVPRLLSVVEIVKREFIKSLEAKHSLRLAGLHQYNEIGCLEDLGVLEEEPEKEDRATEIARALSGSNHVRQKQTPYMKITLSNCALPELEEKGATYQPPVIRKLSKSAKMRMKKRERAAKKGTSAQDAEGSDAIVPD